MAKSPKYSPIWPQTTSDWVELQKLTTFEWSVEQKAQSFPLAVFSLSLWPETCGWMPMKNDTDRPDPQEAHANNAAWENYYTNPLDQPQVAWPGHLQPQSHAKYKTIVIVCSTFYCEEQKDKRGKKSWCNVIHALLWLILVERIHQTCRGQDQTLWSLLGNSFNSYQIIPPQLPSSLCSQAGDMWARYNETKLCHLKKAAVPFLASQKLQLSHSQLLRQKTEEQIRAEKWQSAKRGEIWMRKMCAKKRVPLILRVPLKRHVMCE